MQEQQEKDILFSVVIPVYNVENYLAECLDSVIRQAKKLADSVEILLVDDGSKDTSGAICDKYAAQHPEIITVFHKQNEGLLLTRRYGFIRAKGEYIVNCDSDDVMEYDALCRLKAAIEQTGRPDVLFFNCNLYSGARKQEACECLFPKIKEHLSVNYISKATVLTEFMHSPWIVSMWGKVFKRSCLNFDIDYSSWGRLNTGEDTLQSIEIFDNANTFAYIKRPLYNYRIGSGMTGKFDANYYDTFRDIFKELEKRKELWNMQNFDMLLSEKVLAMAGRAITQSRYNNWGGYAGI